MKALILWLLCIGVAYAEPIATAIRGDITVTLTTEPCVLAAISNLPLRATWFEGVTIEGCYVLSSQMVVAYWADKTVTVIPVQMFRRVTGI